MISDRFLWHVGFILTTGLSVVLSILLFTSVADSRLSWLLLMGIAVALELGKIVTLNDHRPVIAGLLIAVSVLGSAGGLSRALDVTGQGVDQSQQHRQLLVAQIEQNNRAIDRYLELDRITDYALPLQQENEQLREKLQALPVVDVPALTSVLALLATLLALPLDWVQALVVLLLAGLLDALMVTFIRGGVLAEGQDGGDGHDGERWPLPEPESTDDPETVETTTKTATPANVQAMADSYAAFRRLMLVRRDSGQPVLSQRACIRQLNLKDRQVRGFFGRLVAEGVLEKRRGQYEWKQEKVRQLRVF